MSEYSCVKSGKLVLKGESSSSSKKRKHKKHKKEKDESGHSKKSKTIDEDAVKHGGWWKADKVEQMTGNVAISFGDRCYVQAQDSGLFVLGAPHHENEGPSPEEILTAFIINGTKVAFKSGYNKYLSAGSNGRVTGFSDAVGANEQWEPVFENGQMAFQGGNGCFMGVDPEDDAIVSIRKRVGENEVAVLRSCNVRDTGDKEVKPIEETGDITQVEINYVKKFQKFQDKKLRVNQGDRAALETAKETGTLHEALLDRRSKMKADRYCKWWGSKE